MDASSLARSVCAAATSRSAYSYAFVSRQIIARRIGFVSGTAPLADYHRIEPHQNISVGSNTVNDLVGSVVGWAQRNV